MSYNLVVATAKTKYAIIIHFTFYYLSILPFYHTSILLYCNPSILLFTTTHVPLVLTVKQRTVDKFTALFCSLMVIRHHYCTVLEECPNKPDKGQCRLYKKCLLLRGSIVLDKDIVMESLCSALLIKTTSSIGKGKECIPNQAA